MNNKVFSGLCLSVIVLTLGSCNKRTPDMKLAEVSGPVKQVLTQSYVSDSNGRQLEDTMSWNKRRVEFDKNGEIVRGTYFLNESDTTSIRIYRDKKGQIILIQKYDPLCLCWFDTHIRYNQDGMVSEYDQESIDGESHFTCTYDENGNLCEEREVVTKGEPYNAVTRYRMLETDEHGNWIRTMARTDYDISGEKTTEYRIDLRQIT
ncbi:MAG: hypothetical protein K6E45_05475, partial [Bacteroidaceae bacterium]|nr:hypothetical protein [Bacteroidaceae bacterium]